MYGSASTVGHLEDHYKDPLRHSTEQGGQPLAPEPAKLLNCHYPKIFQKNPAVIAHYQNCKMSGDKLNLTYLIRSSPSTDCIILIKYRNNPQS